MRKFLCAALGGLVLLAGSPSFAEPSPDDRAVSRSLFDQGRALLRDGNYAAACPKLEESNRLDTGVGTLFNLADCYEHIGRFASAWASFGEAADLAKNAGQAEREGVARERANALVPKLSKLRVHIGPPLPPGLELRYDGKALSTAILETEMPVDPGEHRIVATAPGKERAEIAVRIEPGTGVASVDFPPLADAPVAPVGPPVLELSASRHESNSSWQKPVAIGAGAGAIVALGIGTIFGLKANGEWSDAQASCAGNRCNAQGYASWEDSRSSATISTVGFVAGGVLAAAAVVLFVTAGRDAPTDPASTTAGRLRRMP